MGNNIGNQFLEFLRSFNAWRDDFLIEASTLLLMAGFAMGTVDIFIHGTISTSQWFVVCFAVIQAIAIDGLFFAVWSKVRQAEWTLKNLPKNLSLIGVGLVLSIVVMLTNLIITYQQINGIFDSIQVMKLLNINAVTFVYGRAILVVLVSILVSLLCREYKPKKTITSSRVGTSQNTQAVIESTGISTGRKSRGARELIKSTWIKLGSNGEKVKLESIVKETGLGLSTVKKYSAGIRKELQSV